MLHRDLHSHRVRCVALIMYTGIAGASLVGASSVGIVGVDFTIALVWMFGGGVVFRPPSLRPGAFLTVATV